MFSFLRFVSVALALAATSACFAIFEMAYKQIVAFKRMTFGATCRIAKLHYPTTIRVLASREKSEVVWVEASGVSALVINGHSSRDVPIENEVHDNVNSYGGCFTEHLNSCVMPKTGSGFGASGPFPAIRFPIYLALICDAFQQWFWWSSNSHNEKPIRAPKVKSAHDWPQSGHGLESSLFSCFWRLLQSRALA